MKQTRWLMLLGLLFCGITSACLYATEEETFEQRRARMQAQVDAAVSGSSPAAETPAAAANPNPAETSFAGSSPETRRLDRMQENPYQIGTAGTVPLSGIRVLQYLLPHSKNYQIDPTVVVEGYYYRFLVHAPHGEYEVVSIRKLMQLCREIDVLEDFRNTNSDNQVMEGIKNSALTIGKGLGRILIKPGDSFVAIGAGTGKTARLVKNAFAAPFREPTRLASDGNDRAQGGKGAFGAERRRVAHELGLDVYTSNPNAYALIDEIAKQRSAGGLPIGLSIFALPGGSVFALSLTPIGHDLETEEMIRDNSPEELVRALRIAYGRRLKMDVSLGSSVRILLENPNFSPREQAYLFRHLYAMREVEGAADACAFLAQTPSPQMASVVSGQVEMLSLLHQRARRLRRFVPIRNTLGAVSADGALCAMLSNDVAVYQRDIETSLDLLKAAADKAGAPVVEVWSTGSIPEATQQAASRRGILCHPDILLEPIFRQQKAQGEARPVALPSLMPPSAN